MNVGLCERGLGNEAAGRAVAGLPISYNPTYLMPNLVNTLTLLENLS